MNVLKEEVSPSNRKDLVKVILFNRQREGEVFRTPMSVYLSRDASEKQEAVNLAFTAHFIWITIKKRKEKFLLLKRNAA